MHSRTIDQMVVVSVLYSLGIVTGTFRSWFRWYTAHFWWEDAWAMIALLLDIVCFVDVWLLRPPHLSKSEVVTAARWMEAVTLTSGLWAARMSMITGIVRITKPCVQFRRPAYATAVTFGIMWVAILIQKLYQCGSRNCDMDQDAAISQLVTDVISDVLLMVLPLCFLRGVKIEHSQRILLISSFASSICITIISVTHTVYLFLPYTATSVILAHVKTALAVIICTLLVIVTFVYRLCRRNDLDMNNNSAKSDGAQFTSVIPEKWSPNGLLRSTSPGISGHRSPSVHNVNTP